MLNNFGSEDMHPETDDTSVSGLTSVDKPTKQPIDEQPEPKTDEVKRPEDLKAPRIDRQPIKDLLQAQLEVKYDIGSEAELSKDTGLMKYILGIKITEFAMWSCRDRSDSFDLVKLQKELEFWIDLASKIPLEEAIRYNDDAVDIFRDRAINQAMNARSFRNNVGKRESTNENDVKLAQAAGECSMIEEGIAYQLVRNENYFSKDNPLTDKQEKYFQRVREKTQEELLLIKGLILEKENNHDEEKSIETNTTIG